jgi:hypothetical protein
MHDGLIRRASGVRPPKSLVARGGLARTFGGLAAFVVIVFLGAGFYVLQDAFASPRSEGSASVLSAAFMITVAAVLLFFLLRPPKRLRTTRRGRVAGAVPAARPALESLSAPLWRRSLRNNLAYQRTYVDHSYIRP